MYIMSEAQAPQTENELTIEEVIADFKENIKHFETKLIPEMKERGKDLLKTIKMCNGEMKRLIFYCDGLKDEIEEMIRGKVCKCCIDKKFTELKNKSNFIKFLKHSSKLEYYNYFISQYGIRGELDKVKECIGITEKLSNDNLELSEEVKDDLIYITQDVNYLTGKKSKPEELIKEGGYIGYAKCLKNNLENHKIFYNMYLDYMGDKARVRIYDLMEDL